MNNNQDNLDLLRKMFEELELHVQLHGIEFRDYFRVLTEEQYEMGHMLPNWEDRHRLVSLEVTPEETERNEDLKDDVKKIEGEAYQYVMGKEAKEMQKIEAEDEDMTEEEIQSAEREGRIETVLDERKQSCVDCGMRLVEWGPGRSDKECSKLKFCKVCNLEHLTNHKWKENKK